MPYSFSSVLGASLTSSTLKHKLQRRNFFCDLYCIRVPMKTLRYKQIELHCLVASQ